MVATPTQNNIPLTKGQCTSLVNDALSENGEKPKPEDEIDEVYTFYRRMWDEDEGLSEVRMEEHDGHMQAVFG